MISSIAFSMLRHILTAAGTWAVAKGFTDIGTVEQVVGALVTIATLVWAALEKKDRV